MNAHVDDNEVGFVDRLRGLQAVREQRADDSSESTWFFAAQGLVEPVAMPERLLADSPDRVRMLGEREWAVMTLPLDDIRVVDLTIARAGPQQRAAARGDWGADVVRLEPSDPAGAGDARNPIAQAHCAARPEGGRRIRHAATAHERRRHGGEHAAPGEAHKLGFGWEIARPQPTARLRADPAGQDGPYAERGVDQIAKAWAA
jgi:hypothetical protein